MVVVESSKGKTFLDLFCIDLIQLSKDDEEQDVQSKDDTHHHKQDVSLLQQSERHPR